MARPIVLSNGELHVGINNFGLVHDLYFPYVGLENHTAGRNARHKIGVWVDGVISWLDTASEWTYEFDYPHNALIGHTIIRNESLGVMLEFDDFVNAHMSAFLRNIHVVNLSDKPREIRLFMHQAFALGDSGSATDTAQYLPHSNAVMHYRGNRVMVIGGLHNEQPFDQYTMGLFGIENREGTFRDAEDGELNACNVEHGRVDSTIRFTLNLGARESGRVHYWIAAGKSLREALYVHKQIQELGLYEHMYRTANWWQKWLEPAFKVQDKLPHKYKRSFIQSLLVIKSQIDKRGAIMASTDSAMLNYSRDAYAYSWPRDAGHILWPLIRLGFKDEAYRFFEFAKQGMHPAGYLFHKYQANGAVGSSWHPYVHGDIIAPPIQEDETALIIFIFSEYYKRHASPQLIKDFYDSLIVPAANFMADFVDDYTGLPRPTYDLWEEVFLTTTYSTSVTYAALLASADIAAEAKDQERAVAWRMAAEDIQSAAKKHLFNEDRNYFYKGVLVGEDGNITYNDTIDSSAVGGAYLFGLFDEDTIARARKTLEERFDTENNIGVPRYENDNYRRTSDEVTGNIWFITSFWLAQQYIDNGESDKAERILSWAHQHTTNSGMLGEQINPANGNIVAPVPLTWSQAELVSTLLDFVAEER